MRARVRNTRSMSSVHECMRACMRACVCACVRMRMELTCVLAACGYGRVPRLHAAAARG